MIRNNKIYKQVTLSIVLLACISGCDSFLEVESYTKVSTDILLSNEAGLKTIIANLYNGMPMEDFNYKPNIGFNVRGGNNTGGNLLIHHLTDEAVLSSNAGSSVGPGTYNYFSGSTFTGMGPNEQVNVNGYGTNRDVSIFLKSIENAKNIGIISENKYNHLWSEAHFIRAYVYFGLAKRYGGVPIIDWLQDDDYKGDPAPLYIPRNTESDTWKFVLSECDKAIQYLPTPEEFSDDDGNPMYRANKWTAYALKSRAALYAASLAKFGYRATFTGEAVNQKLIGIDATESASFYNECLNASKAIIDNAPYSLYMPDPVDAQEAATNYQNLFMNSPSGEIIFAKYYMPVSLAPGNGHDWDVYFSPSQASTGYYRWGQFGPTLDLVDVFEDYADDGTGASVKIVTRTDGVEDQFINTNTPTNTQLLNIPFVKYDDPYEPFKNKDARLLGAILVPGSSYKGVTIVMQGGLIGKDGSTYLYESYSEEGHDGKMYYTYGAASPSGFSAFSTMTSADDAMFSTTGFSLRKYMAENKTIPGIERSSSTQWIDFRLAEIYLNYAEAVVESGSGDASLATKLINDLRKRAAHTDIIPLTIENVLKERRVELMFEGHRLWDLFRRREYHTLYNNFRRSSLVGMIDLRESKPKYVYVRMQNFHDIRNGGRTFQPYNYYFEIPGVDVSGLVQNPGR